MLSVDTIGMYKPRPEVYALVIERFRLSPREVVFVSSNRWDVAGACAFGFRTAWVNRAGLPDEYPDMVAGRDGARPDKHHWAVQERLNQLPGRAKNRRQCVDGTDDDELPSSTNKIDTGRIQCVCGCRSCSASHSCHSLPGTPPAQDGAVYTVSYIDAVPASRAAVAAALQKLATASRKDDGNLRYEILQRGAPANQFAIVSIWKDQKAYDAHMAAAHTKDFREKQKPQLISLIDDRVHSGMEIGAADAKVPAGAVFVVTHVDVPPPKKDECIAALKTLVADSRKEGGMVRFEVFRSPAGRTISPWSRSGRTRRPTTITSSRRRTRNSATRSRR